MHSKYVTLLLLVLIKFIHITDAQLGIVSAVFKFLAEGGDRLKRELVDQQQILPEYDFIIVGAGSAGCVMANRLSENPKWKVLLIEAGNNENLLMDIPLFVHYLQEFDINWNYKTEPQTNACLGMNNNQCRWPRGKVMGGSSVLNYMIYTRGNYRDYNRWAAMGNKGWSWSDVEPYFRKLENYKVSGVEPGIHGTRGPITVSNQNWRSAAAKAFVHAGIEKGHSYVDYNGESQVGFSYLQVFF